ncbi:hypothetical protein PROFUN_08271 [Planoprotostelium fungivorum]|uniref:UDP-Glycosyltransferase/glycogen phosphorylase n=1 Tax=Planoprotostelium fungivorum TaxID=1890364 RepID=A0A2P6NJX3_9EUKA|nr:hypothetical protein PROFUN_08271 [Planoprotostelium fungivorum]
MGNNAGYCVVDLRRSDMTNPHIVYIAVPVFSRARLMVGTVAKALTVNAHIRSTVIIHELKAQQVKTDLQRALSSAGATECTDVHFETFQPKEGGDILSSMSCYAQELKPAFANVLEKRGSADLIIVDNNVPVSAVADLRALQPGVKIWCYFPAEPLALYKYIAPPLLPLSPQELMQRGLQILNNPKPTDPEEIWKVIDRSDGGTMNIPGIGPLYLRELYSELSKEVVINSLIGGSIPTYDTLVVNVNYDQSRETCQELSALGYKVVPCGMSGAFPIHPVTTAEELPDDPETAKKVKEYLDSILRERSVLYISFGSMHFPPAEQMGDFIDVIMEMDVPVVIAKSVPQHFKSLETKLEVLVQSKKGLVINWAPQHAILSHPATNVMLTHCGWGSITECISYSVVMIGWPLVGDQPTNAIMVERSWEIGYHLKQVFQGVNVGKQLYGTDIVVKGTAEARKEEMRDTLNKALGADGKKKREKMAELGDIYQKSITSSELWLKEAGFPRSSV